jgi:hypothetical protein
MNRFADDLDAELAERSELKAKGLIVPREKSTDYLSDKYQTTTIEIERRDREHATRHPVA